MSVYAREVDASLAQCFRDRIAGNTNLLDQGIVVEWRDPQATLMRRLLARVLTLGLVVLIVPTAPVRAATIEPPATPVGAQVAWLLEVSSRLPISEAEAAEHFSREFLAVVPLAEINAVFAAIAGPTGFTLLRYEGDDTTARPWSRAPGFGSASWASPRKDGSARFPSSRTCPHRRPGRSWTIAWPP